MQYAPAPIAESTLAWIKSLEAKFGQLALETANLAARKVSPGKSSADAFTTNQPLDPCYLNAKRGTKAKRLPSAPSPPKAPRLPLSQLSSEKSGFVQMTSDAKTLASRATAALTSAL